MRLQIEAGAYEGVFDLGGLSLQELDVADGAANTQVTFSSPNPSQMERLRYVTGASTVTPDGLGERQSGRDGVHGRGGHLCAGFLRSASL